MANSDSATIALPNDATAPALARHFLAEHGSGLASEVIDDAELLVSELVTNALCHGRPSITLRLCTEPPKIEVAVQDAGDVMSLEPQPPGATKTSGRGLFIVDAVASAWGVTPHSPPPGKTVWFELGNP